MSKFTKFVRTLLVLGMLTAITATAAYAGSDSNVYGLVFIDNNLNGVWDQGEEGYTGEWTEYWENDELIRHYVGATITLSADDGVTAYTLESAGHQDPDDDGNAVCTYQDFLVSDGEDEDGDPDINPSPVRPCDGTWGMVSGETGMVWKVWVTAPTGYVVTSANPQYFTVGSGAPALNFGIAPIGAGGATTTSAVTTPQTTSGIALPVTGGMALGLSAIALIAVGGAAVLAGAKRRK